MAPFLSDMPAVGRGRDTQTRAFFLDFEELWRHTGYQTGNLQWGRRGGWLCMSMLIFEKRILRSDHLHMALDLPLLQ